MKIRNSFLIAKEEKAPFSCLFGYNNTSFFCFCCDNGGCGISAGTYFQSCS